MRLIMNKKTKEIGIQYSHFDGCDYVYLEVNEFWLVLPCLGKSV